jgi:tetratricopeptide (TPR) repeat protein
VYAGLAERSRRADLEVNGGASLARLGDDTGAMAAYARALAIEPEHPKALMYRANSLLRLGDTAAAVAAYQSFLAGHPTGESAEQVKRVLAQIAP